MAVPATGEHPLLTVPDGAAEFQYAERIERGAAFLDEKVPGWRDRIDLDVLDIGDCDRCILSQLEAWSVAPHAEAAHGFDLPLGEIGIEGYAPLTEEWRSYIEATR